MTHRLLLGVALWTLVSVRALAQSAPVDEDLPPPESTVTGYVSNMSRLETWRFFESPVPGVDPHYTFFGNRAELGLRVRAPRFDLSGAFAYVRLERLPTDAIGPGGLGTGAFYFASSGLPYSYQVFLSELTVSGHTRDRRVTLTAGRLPHVSGAEGTHVHTNRASPHLRELRRLSLDGRLLGTFDWSLYQRRFDGLRVDLDGGGRYGGAAVFLVTQGVYEESANLTMKRLQVGSAWAGWRHGTQGETQAFAHVYRDRRAIDFRPDNANVATDVADITVFAMGASHAGTESVGPGAADWLLWGAAQGGDWYGQQHRAWAGTLEGGYRWRSASAPWLRAGLAFASGDQSPADDQHGTFFPMLANVRTYAQSMVYAPMNLRDAYVQFMIEPQAHARLRLDVHHLDLADAADRWYQGSGATVSEGRYFGYSPRVSGGSHRLGTVVEGSAEVRLSRYWSINAYLARMWGGPVVRARFTGDRLLYWYIENVLRLDLATR